MTLHGNAKTCPHSRLLLVRRVLEQGWRVAEAATAAGLRRFAGRFVEPS